MRALSSKTKAAGEWPPAAFLEGALSLAQFPWGWRRLGQGRWDMGPDGSDSDTMQTIRSTKGCLNAMVS